MIPELHPPAWAVVTVDRLVRWWFGIDRPEASVGPVLCVQVRTLRRPLRLPDGSTLAGGEPIGVIHFDNRRVWRLHDAARSRVDAFFSLSRLIEESLRNLSSLSGDGARFAHVRAYSGTTVFHRFVMRFGFRPSPNEPPAPGRDTVLGEWLRAIPPGYSGRVRRSAARVWLTREELLRRFPG